MIARKCFAVATCAALIGFTVFASAAPNAAPEFEAKGISGKTHRLSDYRGKIVVLETFNPGCPYVKRVYENKYVQGLQSEFTEMGFVWLTINSTSSDHQDFLDVKETQALTKEWGLESSDVIIDAEGKLGKLYDAKTTPNFFVIGREGELLYQGALDNYSEVSDEPEKAVPYLKEVLDEVAAGKRPTRSVSKPYGCSIKYKS